MKKSLYALLAGLVILGTTTAIEAHGLFRSHGGCQVDCAEPCAPAPVTYVEQKVTRYKSVMVEKDIEVVVCKQVAREEKFTYNVQVPVTKQEVRKYTVSVPKPREEEFTYNVMVPKTVSRKVNVTTYNCVTETVVDTVPVCRIVRVPYTDECGHCCFRCERVTENVQVNRYVVKHVPVTREVVVNEVVCETQTRVGKRVVCDWVQEAREATVNVCNWVTETREGTRTVCDLVTEKVTRKVQVCQLQPYEETIRVPVQSCVSDCVGYGHRGHHGHRGY